MLFFGAVLNECWTHLTVAEPASGNRRACFDHFFADDEAVNRWSTTATELLWPNHSEVTLLRELLRELLGIAIHPRDVVAAIFAHTFGGKFSGLAA